MIKEAINDLVNKKDLSYEEAETVMDEIMTGEASQVHMAAFLMALRMKGETVEEITACANGMRKAGLKLPVQEDVLEIVGTGGDEANSINISTISSIIVAASGSKVAKHGNRSVSSKCGAADCLEALGVKIDIEPEKSLEVLKEANICFMFAQRYHSAMRFVGPVRKELGTRTVFNILGPLTNPASATQQLLGVYSEVLVDPMVHVLDRLGVKRAMVVYGQDGLDEISLSAPTTYAELNHGVITKGVLTPEEFGFVRCKKEDLAGGDPVENARLAREILNGAKGAKRDAVLFNAGVGIYLMREGITIQEGIEIARKVIDSGKAAAKLEQFISLSNIA